MRKNLFLLLLVFIPVVGMSQNEPSNTYTNPHSAYVNGEELLVFDNENMFISAVARITSKDYGFGNELKVALSLTNKSDIPVNFIPEKCTAFEMRKSKKKELKVYSSKEFLKKMRKNILWFGPDNVESVAGANTVVKDKNGNKLGSVSTNAKMYTGAADEAYKNADDYIREMYLKKNTLFRDKEVKGILVIQKPKGESVEFHLMVGNDEYIFNFTME